MESSSVSQSHEAKRKFKKHDKKDKVERKFDDDNEAEAVIPGPKKAKTTGGESSVPKKPSGFDRGLEPKEILGMTNTKYGLMFVMKWANSEDLELVDVGEANRKCQDIVMKFFDTKN